MGGSGPVGGIASGGTKGWGETEGKWMGEKLRFMDLFFVFEFPKHFFPLYKLLSPFFKKN